MFQPLTDEDLSSFEKGMACCESCQKWFDMEGQPPLMEYTCDTCGGMVITPMRISTFWLYRLIGEGGMGHVYLAQQKDDPKLYAIKIADIVDEDDFRYNCLLYEGEIYMGLSHPNIPEAYNAGHKIGLAFLIMDYEPGENLEEFMCNPENFPLSESLLLIWMSQLSDALKYMISQGYIYRDMKPQNLVVNGERIVITDMGLAMHLDHGNDIDEDNFVGSPWYLPPERIEAEQEDVRSDIYSLGMVMFMAAAGFSYFDEPDHMRVLDMHILTERTPVKDLYPEMSDGFAAIIDKCIQRFPQDRYQSYEELEADIAALKASLVVVS
ncbi:MAG: serine/threonine protein kinase [Lentisphaeraceae bacterium]|nr:serine/threonine protein kinase [Lentisphaeraceae bacterium]